MRKICYTLGITAIVLFVGLMMAPSANAYTWYMGVFHKPHHIVYVENHAGTRWAYYVQWAAGQWDYGTPHVSVRYGYCRTGASCVRVYAGWYGYNGIAGWAPFSYSGKTILDPSYVYLNNSYYYTAHNARQLLCHEEGHAIGVEYHTSTLGSCMYSNIQWNASMYPSAGDRLHIDTAYASF